MKLWHWTALMVIILLGLAYYEGWISLPSQNQTILPGNLPNSTLTPGAIDNKVTQDNIHQTICVSGYSASVRPPTSFTNGLKAMQIKQYNFNDTNLADYEEDHLISLELGGCPKCPENLWPEHYSGTYGARTKDKLENKLHKIVCDGDMNLSDAQYCIKIDWISCGKKLGVLT